MLGIFLTAPLFISLLAGALRTTTGFPLEMAGPIALALYLVIALVATRLKLLPLCASSTALRALVISLVCTAPFFAPSSFGFVNLGTADGGNHILIFHSFIASDPGAYKGFVGFYALLFIIQKALSTPLETSLLVALGYLIVALVWAVTSWALAMKIRPLLILPLLLTVTIPIAVYLQANGFYPQLYGISVLILTLRYTEALTSACALFIAILAGAALIRFSYGLNLADIILAGSFWMALHRRFLAAGIFGVLAAFAISQLHPIMHFGGAFAPEKLPALVVALMLFFWSTRDRRSLPILFIIGSTLVWLLFGSLVSFKRYYIVKYAISMCLVLGIVCMRELSSSTGTKKKLLICAFIALSIALSPYSTRSFKILMRRAAQPEVDVAAVSNIRQYLEANQKPFGIFVGTRWPRTNMTNSFFNRELRYQDFSSGTLPDISGCTFFDATHGVVERTKKRRPGLSRLLDSLIRAPHAEITYPAAWSEDGDIVIGAACK